MSKDSSLPCATSGWYGVYCVVLAGRRRRRLEKKEKWTGKIVGEKSSSRKLNERGTVRTIWRSRKRGRTRVY